MKHARRTSLLLAGILTLGVIAGGCRTTSTAESHAYHNRAVTSHGYALLFDLLGDEQNVSKLLIVKRERGELSAVIKDVAQTCGDAHKQLERYGVADAALNLKERGLPAAETKTREAIAKTRAKELLTKGGKEFELRLLLTQNEALTYAAHIARVVRQEEPAPDRRRFLDQLEVELTRLQERVLAMLMVHYSWKSDQ